MLTRQFRNRRSLSIIALLAGVLAAGTAILLFHPGDRSAIPPKVVANDVSGRATACLATDTATANKSDQVAKIWSAVQAAGAQSGKNVEQLIKPATDSGQATPYLAGLVSQRCDLIITIGPAFGQAVPTLAKADPAIRFTAVDSSLTTAPPGVTVAPTDQAVAFIQQQVQTVQRTGDPHS